MKGREIKPGLIFLLILASAVIMSTFSCTRVTKLDVELKDYDIVKNTVIYYGGDYCGSCRSFKPNWDEVSKMDEFKNVNFLEEKDVRASVNFQFKVRTVPTLVFIDEYGNVTKINSSQSVSKLKENLNKYLNTND